MQVALNVPDPDEPLYCVTVQLKFTQASASEPDDPGSDCVVPHVPTSDCADVVVVALGLNMSVRNSKQAELATDAVTRTATSIARRILFLPETLQQAACPPKPCAKAEPTYGHHL